MTKRERQRNGLPHLNICPSFSHTKVPSVGRRGQDPEQHERSLRGTLATIEASRRRVRVTLAETAAGLWERRASRISHVAIRLQLLAGCNGRSALRGCHVLCTKAKVHMHTPLVGRNPRLPSAPRPPPVNLLSEAAGQEEGGAGFQALPGRPWDG